MDDDPEYGESSHMLTTSLRGSDAPITLVDAQYENTVILPVQWQTAFSIRSREHISRSTVPWRNVGKSSRASDRQVMHEPCVALWRVVINIYPDQNTHAKFAARIIFHS
jgi:hypothetical protein